jgi:hypothetical protein
MKRLSLSTIAVLSLLCGCQRDISGTYIATDSSNVVWLQLVRTPDDHLTGQMAFSTISADGKISQDAVAIAGAINGENVTISVSRWMGLQTATFGGTFEGNKLTLTGGGEASPMVLKRTALSDYQQQFDQLNARSQTILAAKAAADARKAAEQAQRNFVAQIDQIIGNMQRFDSEADVHLGRFPGVEKGYQAITAKVNGYVEHERRLAGNANASVIRSQLSVAATQASLATDQAHYQGQYLQSSLETNVRPLVGQAANLDALCHARETLPVAGLPPEQIEARSAACKRLLNALPMFRQQYDAMNAGLAHLEQVYDQEKNKQQALLQAAQKLE